MNELVRANWARALTDEREFKHEQDRLGRLWTLLGITNDVKNDGDWIRATLGGRSVFVQRFGDILKGFENRCAHRAYPLRTTDKGNGPVVCGFHHWRYDQEGRAVGIPMCPELFGTTPRELDARLSQIEIATCGSLIFGRFADNGAADSLEEFLGESFPILDATCTIAGPPNVQKGVVEANWKLSIQITLDDYHIVAVHGRPVYQRNEELHYFRFGLHSAHFVGHDTLTSMATDCRNNSYRPNHYHIFNIFPNLLVSLFKAKPYWYCHIQQFVPAAPGRSNLRGWYYPTQFPAEAESAFDRLTRPISEPIRARIVRYYIDKIGREDYAACERLQTVAHQIDSRPILGSQEKRIEWFEESYVQAMSGRYGQIAPRRNLGIGGEQ
jgi:phenylpropionate dioxygenase-like ring-hydroxylating dioxygenase large terminal subunit